MFTGSFGTAAKRSGGHDVLGTIYMFHMIIDRLKPFKDAKSANYIVNSSLSSFAVQKINISLGYFVVERTVEAKRNQMLGKLFLKFKSV